MEHLLAILHAVASVSKLHARLGLPRSFGRWLAWAA